MPTPDDQILDEKAIEKLDRRLMNITGIEMANGKHPVSWDEARHDNDLCAKAFELDEALRFSEVGNLNALQIVKKLASLQSQLEQLRAENAQLRNALLPFALLDIRHLRERSDNEPIWAINKSQITNGHIRKAQELIQKAVDEKL